MIKIIIDFSDGSWLEAEIKEGWTDKDLKKLVQSRGYNYYMIDSVNEVRPKQ